MSLKSVPNLCWKQRQEEEKMFHQMGNLRLLDDSFSGVMRREVKEMWWTWNRLGLDESKRGERLIQEQKILSVYSQIFMYFRHIRLRGREKKMRLALLKIFPLFAKTSNAEIGIIKKSAWNFLFTKGYFCLFLTPSIHSQI